MTSSLVGSEMCIRDRTTLVLASAWANDKSQAFPVQKAISSGIGHDTVSYTHLTLPTICSV
eukprot:12873513-Prorocentrum_lima.AAC.1